MNDPPGPQDFGGLPSYHGHFLLESGLHAETWLELDSLFVDPLALAPRLAALASLIAAHDVTAVCGPLLGGAFVAHAVAIQLRLRFYVAARSHSKPEGGLFGATYTLPMHNTIAHGKNDLLSLTTLLARAPQYEPP